VKPAFLHICSYRRTSDAQGKPLLLQPVWAGKWCVRAPPRACEESNKIVAEKKAPPVIRFQHFRLFTVFQF
jgi:hypothetical protein